MIGRVSRLMVLAAAAWALYGSAGALGTPHPTPSAFGPGERLTFAIRYLGLRAGTAVMTVRDGEPLNGRPTWRLQTLAWSEGAIGTFFTVDDRVDSLIDAETLLPYRMEFRKHEGKKTSRTEITFDHAAHTAAVVKDERREVVPIPSGTQHAFSALYFLRARPNVHVGDSVALNVHHEGRNYPVEARVEAAETIKGQWGAQPTYEVKVVMPFRGIWLNEGSMRVWVTADPRHVPLRIRAKMILGSIVAELIEGPNLTPDVPAPSPSAS
jgi:Protein of unknown function (DUF3108)